MRMRIKLWVSSWYNTLLKTCADRHSGRMVHNFLPNQRLFNIKARRFGLYFVLLDFVAFVVQVLGAASASGTNVKESRIMVSTSTNGVPSMVNRRYTDWLAHLYGRRRIPTILHSGLHVHRHSLPAASQPRVFPRPPTSCSAAAVYTVRCPDLDHDPHHLPLNRVLFRHQQHHSQP